MIMQFVGNRSYLKTNFVVSFSSVEEKEKVFFVPIPAMLALMKQIIDPAIKARTANSTMILRFSGHRPPKFPIIIPIELKLAKPQIAYVVIATLRSLNSSIYCFIKFDSDFSNLIFNLPKVHLLFSNHPIFYMQQIH